LQSPFIWENLAVSVKSDVERWLYLVPAHVLFILFLWSYFECVFTDVATPDKQVYCAQTAAHAFTVLRYTSTVGRARGGQLGR
jgi:hypothetical protein